MFIVSLSYKKELAEVEKFIFSHGEFLDTYYLQKKFIFSGRKNPRTGGIILAYNVNRETLEEIIREDPFYQNGIADYDITEVIPTKYDDNFSYFIKQNK